jgi:hypothetical protein
MYRKNSMNWKNIDGSDFRFICISNVVTGEEE